MGCRQNGSGASASGASGASGPMDILRLNIASNRSILPVLSQMTSLASALNDGLLYWPGPGLSSSSSSSSSSIDIRKQAKGLYFHPK